MGLRPAPAPAPAPAGGPGQAVTSGRETAVRGRPHPLSPDWLALTPPRRSPPLPPQDRTLAAACGALPHGPGPAILPGFLKARSPCLCAQRASPCSPRPGDAPPHPGAGRAPTGEGVHEGGQRPVQHLEERISARVLLRAAQDRVLQDVGDPSAVHGRGAELHAAAGRGGGRVRPAPPRLGFRLARLLARAISASWPLVETSGCDVCNH